MGFFSRFFGSSDKSKVVEQVEAVEYKGFLIYPESISESGQFRVAGRITKEIDDELKSHRFIRSDIISNKHDANELMLKKAQMFIDQMGQDIF